MSVDIMAYSHECKLRKSVRQRRGGRDQEAASPFAGIIQIKFKRYNLRTSPSPTRRVCDERVEVSARTGRVGDRCLNTRHACFRFEKIPVDVMSTLLDHDNPGGRRGGVWHPSVLPSRHRTGGCCCSRGGIEKVEIDQLVVEQDFVCECQIPRFIPLFLVIAELRSDSTKITHLHVGGGGAVRGTKYQEGQSCSLTFRFFNHFFSDRYAARDPRAACSDSLFARAEWAFDTL